MKSLQHRFFIACILLFCLNRVLEQAQIYIWPLYAYLDDLLCLPITLQLVLAVQRTYFDDSDMVLPVRHIVFAVAAFSLCFEFILPFYKPLYTADVLDVLAYILGALFFHIYLNKPLHKAVNVEQ